MRDNRLMLYNWQQPDWPDFRYDTAIFQDRLSTLVGHAGRVSGLLDALPEQFGEDAEIDLMIDEAVHSSAIEGETLPRNEVMSSIRNRLGLNAVPEPVRDGLARGAGHLMVAVRSTFAEPLSEQMLCEWHALLLGDGGSPLKVGAWRDGSDPMQVVSGRIDRPTVHFEAPPSATVPAEMSRYIGWFNATAPGGESCIPDAAVRSAIAHLYFESIHPFEDGNGRIGRALSEKVLSQGLGRPAILSLSRVIESKRNDYYAALQAAQRGNGITEWISYFIDVVLAAQLSAEAQITFVVRKSHFLRQFADQFNERQLKAVQRMLDAGPEGFQGGMNARKYTSLTKASKATATRDLQELVSMGVLDAIGAGRSSAYVLTFSDVKR